MREEPLNAFDEVDEAELREFGKNTTPESLLKAQLDHADFWVRQPRPGARGYIIPREPENRKGKR